MSGFSFCGIQIGFAPAGPFVGSTRPAAVAVQRQVRSSSVGTVLLDVTSSSFQKVDLISFRVFLKHKQIHTLTFSFLPYRLSSGRLKSAQVDPTAPHSGLEEPLHRYLIFD